MIRIIRIAFLIELGEELIQLILTVEVSGVIFNLSLLNRLLLKEMRDSLSDNALNHLGNDIVDGIGAVVVVVKLLSSFLISSCVCSTAVLWLPQGLHRRRQ